NRRRAIRCRLCIGVIPLTPDDRVRAVVDLGFTERQARFLVTVMLHSGVCLLRQYTAFAGVVHGQKTSNFFRSSSAADTPRRTRADTTAGASITCIRRRFTEPSARPTAGIAGRSQRAASLKV